MAWEISKTRPLLFIELRPTTSCGLHSAICARNNERKVWFAALDSAPETAADHVDPLAHIGRCPGDDFYEAHSFSRSSVKYNVAFQAQQGYGDGTSAFPNHRRAQ
jgi:hypothetical protein